MPDLIEWTDETSYSRGERGKIEPKSWQFLADGHRVFVTKGHIYYPNVWVMNCHAVGIKEHRLCMSSETKEHAQSLALAQVHVAALRKAESLIKLASAVEAEVEASDA